MAPNLHNGPYALMNAKGGVFFAYTELGQREKMVASLDYIRNDLFLFVLNVEHHHPLTISLVTTHVLEDEFDSNQTHIVGRFVVSNSGSDLYRHFYRLQDPSHVGTDSYFLSPRGKPDPYGSDGLVYKHFNPNDLSQLWHFIHLNDNSLQASMSLLRPKRDQFLQAQYAYHLAGNSWPQQGNNLPSFHPQQNPLQYTGPNLCGDPTCGVTHICNADYNRHVQPFGYTGV